MNENIQKKKQNILTKQHGTMVSTPTSWSLDLRVESWQWD